MTQIRRIVALGAFLGVGGQSLAVTAFTNFGLGDTYDSGGWALHGSSVPPPQDVAVLFTSGASGILDSIRIAVRPFNSSGLLNIVLRNNGASDTVGSVIVAFGVSLPASDGILTVTNTFPSVTLTSGTKYWLEVKAIGATVNAGWAYSNSGVGKLATSSNGGSSYGYSDPARQSAFDVTVANVPEPFSMALMGSAALAGYRRLRRKRA